MFYSIVCIFIFANFLLHDVNLETLKWEFEGYPNEKVNTGKYFQKIRNRRQPLKENADVSEDSSRDAENNERNNPGKWSFGDNEDALIFDDGDFNFRMPPTFPIRQIPFEQAAISSPNFKENIPPTDPTVRIPGMGTRRPICEETCLSTPEYNPVCGDDNVTYPNLGKLQCASRCGRRVSLQFRGACLTRARGR